MLRLNPHAFNALLNNLGQQFRWRQSLACPCRDRHSGAADKRCPRCAGRGYLWRKPVECVSGVSGQRTQATWQKSGRWVEGDVVITVPGDSPMWEIGEFDRATMLNTAERFTDVLTRGAPGERLMHEVASIEGTFWLNPQTKEVVDGPVPTFDERGALTWPPDGPPAGTQYSITGRRRAEYFCFIEMPQARNEHSGERLPKKVVLRRWDVWGRSTPAP